MSGSKHMAERINTLSNRLRIEPYWYLIILFWLGAGALFITHLRTGTTPNRVAIRIPILELDVYWYGICIVGGIALGAYVVSHLALERGQALFKAHVPSSVRERTLADLKFPAEIRGLLNRQKVETVGDLLLRWGFDPRYLGLNRAGMVEVRNRLEATPGIRSEWLADAPWRPWNPDHVWNGVVWCLILALIGARLYHVLTPSPSMAAVGIYSPLDYFRNPYQLINFRDGGLGIYGGIVGGALGLFLYTRRQRIPAAAWADLAVIGLALGQAVGRWGNFFNQELYGRPSDLPWAITIDPIYRLPDYSNASHFHPAFLYESLWNFLAFLVLLTLYRRYASKLLTGDLTALYLILYAIGRILLEMVRLDSRMVALGALHLNLAVASLVSVIVVLLMAGWIGLRHWRQSR
jgi:phosphatidylglycerol:prolipoprotein diacylglycerol transferase